MTCDEFKEMAPAYALIALDEQERAPAPTTWPPDRRTVAATRRSASAELLAAPAGRGPHSPARRRRRYGGPSRRGCRAGEQSPPPRRGRPPARPLPSVRVVAGRRAGGRLPLQRADRSSHAAGGDGPRRTARLVRALAGAGAFSRPARRLGPASGHAERLRLEGVEHQRAQGAGAPARRRQRGRQAGQQVADHRRPARAPARSRVSAAVPQSRPAEITSASRRRSK